jgi:alkanesulfonate monooxygenase SsuD/methylene tetrahydromethanopterin reductase-like flavin-dependent oxidoreductase (luciferase family)
MKVGLFINTQFPEGFNLAERVLEMVAQVRSARDAGFASLWFPHHWLTHPMQMLQITPVMGYVAAHAQGMTIGPNILILPPPNPVHVAEEAATLDVLTGGNYILGIGLGLPTAGVRCFRHQPQRAGAAVQRKHRSDASAVD